MLSVLGEFREKLDSVMNRCIGEKVIIYGYGYSGRFIAWYAEYYHGIKPEVIITEDYTNAIPYELELYRNTIFDLDYKKVNNAIVWVCTVETEEVTATMKKHNYIKNSTYYNFNEIIYGDDYDTENADTNLQFMRFLEKKYNCDIVNRIDYHSYTSYIEGAHECVNLSPKELFPMLDKSHCLQMGYNHVFDFGCGKGSAILSFLDYGFEKVGGVEFENRIYETVTDNFRKLNLDSLIECYHNDATKIKRELDDYNCFYFFDPFEAQIFEKVMKNICGSLERHKRKICIVYVIPRCHECIEATGKFVLTNQFDIMTRQRIVNVYCSI